MKAQVNHVRRIAQPRLPNLFTPWDHSFVSVQDIIICYYCSCLTWLNQIWSRCFSEDVNFFIYSWKVLVATPQIRAGLCSGPTVDFIESAWFESLPGHRLSWLRFLWFSSASLRKFRNSTTIRPRQLPSKSFLIHYSPVIVRFDAIYNLRYWRRHKICIRYTHIPRILIQNHNSMVYKRKE